MRIRKISTVLPAVLLALTNVAALGMTKARRLELRDQVKESFYHAYNGYMENAFPFDELNPLECTGRGRDRLDPKNININDVLGDYLLTLVDTLDTLAVIGDKHMFAQAVNNTIKYLPDFNIDSHVQVFEVTIRMLGGLLSSHIIATDTKDTLGMRLDTQGWYKGELLSLARDLGYRLLPAFEASPNGIPYPRTNLKRGFIRGETPETCSAGFSTILLEFGALSRLTNETIFEDIARHAMNDLWNARSKRNLFGNVYNLETQRWVTPTASIGAGVDSLYEYMLKSYVYFGNPEYLGIFDISYNALLKYIRDTMGGYAFYNVNMQSAEITTTWIDSLSAYFPGLMVLAGDVDGAESAYMLYYHIWKRFRAMPERFNLFLRDPDVIFYPLRPEFIESTYFLYRATKDPFYLDVGEMVLADITELQRTRCGFASMQDVNTHNLEERMESFVLSETLKYLYLLFDDENHLHKLDNNYVFTTEGHVLLPLSPKASSSIQYPSHSSFNKSTLIHLDSPPRTVHSLFYRVDNIRKKLEQLHPDDMFSTPTIYRNGGDSSSRKNDIDKNNASDDGRMASNGILNEADDRAHEALNHKEDNKTQDHLGHIGGIVRSCPVPRSLIVNPRHNPNSNGIARSSSPEDSTTAADGVNNRLEEEVAANKSKGGNRGNARAGGEESAHGAADVASDKRNKEDSHRDINDLLTIKWRTSNRPNPLLQLNGIKDLHKALERGIANKATPLKQKQYLFAVQMNAAALSIPFRPDFYNVGELVRGVGKQYSWDTSGRGSNGTRIVDESLALGLEYNYVCTPPPLSIFAKQHMAWQAAFHSGLNSRETNRNGSQLYTTWKYFEAPPHHGYDIWLAPHTRQVVFSDFLFARSIGSNAVVRHVPDLPKCRNEIPFLSSVRDEEQVLSEEPGSNKLKRRGYSRLLMKRKRHGKDSNRRQTMQNSNEGQLIITNGVANALTDYVVVRLTTDDSPREFVRALPAHNDSVDGYRNGAPPSKSRLSDSASGSTNGDKRRALKSALTGLKTRAEVSGQGNHERDNIVATKGDAQVAVESNSLQREPAEALRNEIPENKRYRRHEYVGKLAEFAEAALYRGAYPYLVPEPQTLVMLHLYSSSSAYGCEHYTPREQWFVRNRVVVVRAGGGCTMWEKAIHARNAGASGLIVDKVVIPKSNNSNKQATNEDARDGYEGGMSEVKRGCVAGMSELEAGICVRDFPPIMALSVMCRAVRLHMHGGSSYDAGKDTKKIRERPEQRQDRIPASEKRVNMSDDTSNNGNDNDSDEAAPAAATSLIDMPVVIVHSSVIDEIENYLIDGLHVKVALL